MADEGEESLMTVGKDAARLVIATGMRMDSTKDAWRVWNQCQTIINLVKIRDVFREAASCICLTVQKED